MEAHRPTFVPRAEPQALLAPFIAAYGTLFDGEPSAFIARLEREDAAPSEDVTLAAPVVPTLGTLHETLPTGAIEAFFWGLHPVWLEPGDPAYLTAIALGAAGRTKPVYELDLDTLEVVRVSGSLDAWLAVTPDATSTRRAKALPSHLDPNALAKRSEWLVAMLGGRIFDPDALADVPTLRAFERERSLIATYPHLAAYWPLHHALVGNTREWEAADALAAASPHPLVAELRSVAARLARGEGPGRGFSALASFHRSYASLLPRGVCAKGARSKAREPFPGHADLLRFNVEEQQGLGHGIGLRYLEHIDAWVDGLPEGVGPAVREALVASLPYRAEQGEPLAMTGLVTAWARFATSYEDFIAPLEPVLTSRISVTRVHEILRALPRFPSDGGARLLLEAARLWVTAFAKKPSSAYFQPQAAGWLALFFTDRPEREALAELLLETPHRGYSRRFVDAHPDTVGKKLARAARELSPPNRDELKRLRETLALAAPTAAARKRLPL